MVFFQFHIGGQALSDSCINIEERQVGVVPVAEHAQATETGLLQLDVLDSELVAELTNLGRGGLVEL